MKPAYRFFYLQDWMAYQGPSLRKLLLDDFGSCRAKWIMTQGDVDSMNISGLLASRYELVGRSEPFGVALFRLRDASARSHEGAAASTPSGSQGKATHTCHTPMGQPGSSQFEVIEC